MEERLRERNFIAKSPGEQTVEAFFCKYMGLRKIESSR